FRPTVFDRNVLPIDIAGFLQALTECGRHGLEAVSRAGVEKPDHRHRRLLRARRERPRHGRAAEARNELATSYSDHFQPLQMGTSCTESVRDAPARTSFDHLVGA